VTSTEAAAGTLRIQRRSGKTKRFVTVMTRIRPIVAGNNALRFKKRLRPGRYRVVVVARDQTGKASAPLRARFRVTRR
jgi:hypothetical protein